MNILIYLIAAAVIGWVATSLMHDRSNLFTEYCHSCHRRISGWLFPQPVIWCWDN